MTIATDLLRLRRFDLLQLWFERIVRESPTKFVLVFEMVTTMASVIIQAGESPKKTKNASKDFKSKITELLEEAINSASSTIQDVSVEMCGELYFAYGLFQSEMYQSPKNAKKVLQTALQY